MPIIVINNNEGGHSRVVIRDTACPNKTNTIEKNKVQSAQKDRALCANTWGEKKQQNPEEQQRK